MLRTAHGTLRLPAFLPDGTRGVVRTVDSADLTACGIEALVVNALHLGETPGMAPIRAAGGIHSFCGWDGPIVSDSGGFQVYSLLSAPGNLAKISDQGFHYALRAGQRKRLLSPERCISQQLALGADVIFCLDQCTHPGDSAEAQLLGVERTLRWARSCRAAFDEGCERAGRDDVLLFAVVQGGNNYDLRRRCAEGLVEIGFDGYGYGGWPVDDDGALVEAVADTAALLPAAAPKHALGIGRPEGVVGAHDAGYTMFDCTLPTRNGRRGLAYVFNGEPLRGEGRFYRTLGVEAERFRRDGRPLEEGCDCAACSRYSRAYISHLLRIGDALGARLMTIHNLRFYARLMDRLDA